MTPSEPQAWRKFPQIERLYESGDLPDVMSRIEQTCRQLDELLRNGGDAEKKRAQAALTAYGRTLDLLRQVEEEAARQSKA
jgi:hypothetical protein